MANFQIHFPKLCAWCGTRPPTAKRKINLSHTSGNQTARMSFEAPICEACEAYANAVKKADRLRTVGAVIGSVIIGILLAFLIFGLRSMMFLPMGGFFSFVVMIIVVSVITSSKVKKQLNQRMVGEAPQGYASNDWQPCYLFSGGKLLFLSAPYQKAFTALNPEIAEK